jgi:glucose-1-phosphate thymidylyltransferase
MEIGKAIVLATETTKLGLWPSLGISAPQLTPVANKPILFHHLEALAAAGVRQVAIVAPGSTGAAIREAVRDGSSFALDVLHVADGPRAVLSSSAIAAVMR